MCILTLQSVLCCGGRFTNLEGFHKFTGFLQSLEGFHKVWRAPQVGLCSLFNACVDNLGCLLWGSTNRLLRSSHRVKWVHVLLLAMGKRQSVMFHCQQSMIVPWQNHMRLSLLEDEQTVVHPEDTSSTHVVVAIIIIIIIIMLLYNTQLRSKRLRWYGHVCRMLDSRLPKVMLFGQVKGSKPPGRPRRSGMTLSCLTFTS